MRKEKVIYSELPIARESPIVSGVLAVTQRQSSHGEGSWWSTGKAQEALTGGCWPGDTGQRPHRSGTS